MALFEQILEGIKGGVGIGAGLSQLTSRPTTTTTVFPPPRATPFELRQQQLLQAITLANLRQAGYDTFFDPNGELRLRERPYTQDEAQQKALESEIRRSVGDVITRNVPQSDLGNYLNAQAMGGVSGRSSINRGELIRAIIAKQRGLGQGQGLGLSPPNFP